MDEQFEYRALLAPDALRALQRRDGAPSLQRLVLHFGLAALCVAFIVGQPQNVLLALPATVLLGCAWAGIFAPFHEATHQTAFATPGGNARAAWLTGIPFGLAPAVYRAFHFEHHRHTHDPARDPELAGATGPSLWPGPGLAWWREALGHRLILLKLRLTLLFALYPPAAWAVVGDWVRTIDDAPALVRECRVLAFCWLAFFVAALAVIPGGGWLLLAAWLGQGLQTLWVMCEHTGLPYDGTILRRTRTVISGPFARFWVWNMNYHAEHHAWPSIPWHRLPDAHRVVAPHLEACAAGYVELHRSVLAGRPLATPPATPEAPPAVDEDGAARAASAG